MLNPTVSCKKPIIVVPTTSPLSIPINIYIAQPKVELEMRTSRLAKSTSTTTKPERERKSTKPKISGGNEFVKIMCARSKTITPIDMVARDSIFRIPDFDALQIAHKITSLCALNVNCNVKISEKRLPQLQPCRSQHVSKSTQTPKY